MLRAVRVRCQSCGCTDESTLALGPQALEGSRLAQLIEGAPLVRAGICQAACLCHEGGTRRDGTRRAGLTFEVDSPRG